MQKLGFTLGFIILALAAFSQFTEIPSRYVDPNLIFKMRPGFSTIEGSPYLDTTFVDAQFSYQNENFQAPLRYNIVNEGFEARHQGQILGLSPEYVDEINLGESTYLYQFFEGQKKVFELLGQNGDKKLLKKHIIVFAQAVTGVPYQDDQPARFEQQKPRYYLMVDGAIKIELSNFKALYKLFPDRKKELQSFIKKQKIDRNSDEGMLKLFAVL